MDQWRERYNEVIGSLRWKAIKARLISERGAKCQTCRAAVLLDLHHKTYERLGRELDEDLELLCRKCHDKADETRAAIGRQRSSAALYEARLDGWASKKYGEDWREADDGSIEEEFEEWCENRE